MNTKALSLPFDRRIPLPYRRLGDERLARLVGEGHAGAFEALYERHHQALYRYCRSMLHHDADAQDALQSTFANALSALSAARRDAPLRPWLFRIAHNETVTLLRRRRPHGELSETLPSAEPAVEQRAELQERLDTLLRDLTELPERQRSALLWRELNGLGHEEIAAALETSPATAKQTIYEARQALVEMAEGRQMRCEEVCRLLADGDRRTLRGRRVRAHLRSCPDCAAFIESVSTRQAELRALTPVIPAGSAALVLSRVLGSSHGSGAAGGGILSAAAAKSALAGLAPKLAVGVAVGALSSGAAIIAVHRQGAPTAKLHPFGARPAGAAFRSGPGAPRAAAERSSSPAYLSVPVGPVSRVRGSHGVGANAPAGDSLTATARPGSGTSGRGNAATDRGGSATGRAGTAGGSSRGSSRGLHGAGKGRAGARTDGSTNRGTSASGTIWKSGAGANRSSSATPAHRHLAGGGNALKSARSSVGGSSTSARSASGSPAGSLVPGIAPDFGRPRT